MALYRAPELDSFPWQGTVKDRHLDTPPVSPNKGDRYIIAPAGTGDWATHDNAITYWDGTAWVFVTPGEGQACWVEDEKVFVRHDGTSWDVLVPASGGSGYTLQANAMQVAAPPDGATYFFGGANLAVQIASGVARIYCPKAGTIKAAYIMMYASTMGTNENISVYIRKNNTTDTLVSTLGIASAYRIFSNTSLSIAVNAGDYIEVKVVCPNWATNPAGVTFSGSIYIE